MQCEACHGAGSLHAQARRLGAVDRPSAVLFTPGEEGKGSCATCHMERRPHIEVLENGYRRPSVQRQYKTPVNLTVSPDGSRLYVVCENSDSVVVLDPRRGRILDEYPVGRRPHDAALAPDGRTLYVTNRLSGTLTAIDTVKGKISAEVPVGAEPHGVLTDRQGPPGLRAQHRRGFHLRARCPRTRRGQPALRGCRALVAGARSAG